MKKNRNKNRGFSLVEAIIVLGILSVFSLFAVISYSSFRQSLTIKNASSEFENMLNNARARAINQNAHFQFVYDFDLKEYWIDEIFANGAVKKPKVFAPKQLDERVLVTNAIIDASAISSGPAKVHFFPAGRSSYSRFYIIRKDADLSKVSNYHTVLTYSSTALSHVFPNEKR